MARSICKFGQSIYRHRKHSCSKWNGNIDFSLGIHFNITLVGNTTLTFTNYLPYKSIKVQTLQINSASSAHTLALPAGVTFTTAIDLSATTKNNFLSVNILGTDLFQCANLVKTIV